jgi:hypothetical protein
MTADVSSNRAQLSPRLRDRIAGILYSIGRGLKAVLQRDDKYEGVRRINIDLLRLVFVLMFFLLGKDTWTEILTHQGAWEPVHAVVWSVWTAFATLAGLGIIRPLRMLPILLLEIFYKVLWLIIVAFPLWSNGTLVGSKAEGIASVFEWVILPIVAVPWGYVFVNYIYNWGPQRRGTVTTTRP